MAGKGMDRGEELARLEDRWPLNQEHQATKYSQGPLCPISSHSTTGD